MTVTTANTHIITGDMLTLPGWLMLQEGFCGPVQHIAMDREA